MNAREEIGRALYMLRAGTDPDVFMQTLRAYVIEESTPEQIAELLALIRKARPDAAADAALAEVERIRAETLDLVAPILGKKVHAKKLSGKKAKPRAHRKELRV